MADMQTLMSMVQRLEGQGIDVVSLLQRAAMGAGGAAGSLGAAGAGAVSDTEFMGRKIPRYEAFQGPGPGAVMDMERTQQMIESRNSLPDFMKPALQDLMRNSQMPGPRQVRPVPPGLLQLFGGM